MATLKGINARVVPRRYEETRPALLQVFSHQKIIDLGKDIHQKTLDICEKDKTAAVHQYVNATKAKCEAQKQVALDDQSEKLAAQHDRTTKRLERQHEKILKEKILEVETKMSRWGVGEVDKEREAGEQRLKEAVARTEENCHQELLAAVAKARDEEQKTAALAAAQVAADHAQLLQQTKEAAAEDKERALLALKEEKAAEQEAAVAVAREEEQTQAREELSRTRDMYEQQIIEYKCQLRKREEEIVRSCQELRNLGHAHKELEGELISTREEFQNFIDKTRPFDDGQSEYALPPVKSIVFT